MQSLRSQQTPIQPFSTPYIGGYGGMSPAMMNPGMMSPQLNAANRARFNAMQGRAGTATPRAVSTGVGAGAAPRASRLGM